MNCRHGSLIRKTIPNDKVTKEDYERSLKEDAIAQILEQIFYNESIGFRPNRNCHQAVREIIEKIQYRKTNYVVEAGHTNLNAPCI